MHTAQQYGLIPFRDLTGGIQGDLVCQAVLNHHFAEIVIAAGKPGFPSCHRVFCAAGPDGLRYCGKGYNKAVYTAVRLSHFHPQVTGVVCGIQIVYFKRAGGNCDRINLLISLPDGDFGITAGDPLNTRGISAFIVRQHPLISAQADPFKSHTG